METVYGANKSFILHIKTVRSSRISLMLHFKNPVQKTANEVKKNKQKKLKESLMEHRYLKNQYLGQNRGNTVFHWTGSKCKITWIMKSKQ